MSAILTIQILLLTLFAALLGGCIGASAARLYSLKQARAAKAASSAKIQAMKREIAELGSAIEHTQLALESERQLVAKSTQNQSQLTVQQDAMQVHARLQGQRISTLEAALRNAEEKSIRLERDFASFRANKLREVRMLKVNHDEWLDSEELPVLNKKVAASGEIDLSGGTMSGNMSKASKVSRSQPIISQELDFPSLAESELPDSVAELEFEFSDTSKQD